MPYVVSPRGMLQGAALRIGNNRKWWAYRLVEQANLKRAAMLHATSEQEAVTLRALFPHKRVIVLPNGIDLPDLADYPPGSMRQELVISPAVPLVVFLGRIHPIKRLDLLILSFGLVRRAYPTAVLALAGSCEPRYAATLARMIRTEGVRFIGQVEDDRKWRLLVDANVFVMCSDSENFGISAGEALAAGTPVVVTRTCPWGMVETAGAGFWVEQEAAAIASGINRLLGDPSVARKMGSRGRALAKSRFDWDQIGAKMAVEYQLLVDNTERITEPRGREDFRS